MHLVTHAAMSVIYLGKVFVIRKVDESVRPRKGESGEKEGKPPNVKSAMVKIGVCMLGDHVAKKVVMGLA